MTMSAPRIDTQTEVTVDAAAIPSTSNFRIRNKPIPDGPELTRSSAAAADVNLEVALKIKPIPHKGNAHAHKGLTVVDAGPIDSPTPSASGSNLSSLQSLPPVTAHMPAGALNAMSLPPQRVARHRVIGVVVNRTPTSNPRPSQTGDGGGEWTL